MKRVGEVFILIALGFASGCNTKATAPEDKLPPPEYSLPQTADLFRGWWSVWVDGKDSGVALGFIEDWSIELPDDWVPDPNGADEPAETPRGMMMLWDPSAGCLDVGVIWGLRFTQMDVFESPYPDGELRPVAWLWVLNGGVLGLGDEVWGIDPYCERGDTECIVDGIEDLRATAFLMVPGGPNEPLAEFRLVRISDDLCQEQPLGTISAPSKKVGAITPSLKMLKQLQVVAPTLRVRSLIADLIESEVGSGYLQTR